MAVFKCLNSHSWPKGRNNQYEAYFHPVGFPNIAVVFGFWPMFESGVIWIDATELYEYQNGHRIFSGPNDFARMKPDDNGAKFNWVDNQK